MKRITNKNVLKSYKRTVITLIIGIILLSVAAFLIYLGIKNNQKESSDIKYLNDIIEKSVEKEDQKSYLNISFLSPKVAVYDDTTDAYYFAYDNQYWYLVYLKEDKAKKIEKMDLKDKPYKLTGVTKMAPNDVKQIAVDVYNDYLADEEHKITTADYNKVFGHVCLDTTKSYSETTGGYYGIASLFIIIGAIVFLVGLVNNLKFKKNVKKLENHEIETLEREMSSKEAFYYSKKNLYLTENYIVILEGTFKPYKYPDVVWMFPFEQRYNGIKTNKAIKIGTADGKIHMICNIPINTKKDQAIYDEIWESLAKKNENIKIGYTQENIKWFNQLKKELKQKKI